jgi:hypothetical protein
METKSKLILVHELTVLLGTFGPHLECRARRIALVEDCEGV